MAAVATQCHTLMGTLGYLPVQLLQRVQAARRHAAPLMVVVRPLDQRVADEDEVAELRAFPLAGQALSVPSD